MRAMAVWGIAVSMSIACSGGDHASVAPEPAPPRSSAGTSAPTSSVLEADEPDAGPVVTLAASTTPSDVRRIHVGYAGVSAIASTRIDALYESTRTRFAVDARAAAAHDRATPERPRCDRWPIGDAFVSFLCATRWEDDGREAYPAGFVRTFAFEIDGDDVRPIDIASAFVDRAAFDATIVDSRARLCDDVRDHHADVPDYQPCPDRWMPGEATLGGSAVWVTWHLTADSAVSLAARVPYADILDRLRADGAVARILHLGAFASERVAEPPPAGAEGPGPWALTGPVPDIEAARRWSALAPGLRADVVAYTTPTPGMVSLGVEAHRGITRARELAVALGGTLVPVASDAALRTLELRRATRSLNVRAEAESTSTWVRTLPRGAIVTVLVDPTAASAPWLTVLAAGVEGMASSRYLDDEDCSPDPTTTLRALPRGPERERGMREVLAVHAGVPDHDRLAPAMLLLTPGRTVLARFDPTTCTIGDRIGDWTTYDVVDAIVTRTAADDGEPLVLVQCEASTDGEPDLHAGTSWSALRVGAPNAVWRRSGAPHPSLTNDVVAPATRGPSGHGFWPLAIVRREQPIVTYHWDGATLVEDAP